MYASIDEPPSLIFVGGNTNGPSPGQFVSMAPTDEELSAAIGATVRARSDRRGWDVPGLPAGYRLLAEDPSPAPSLRREWSSPDGRTLRVSIGRSPQAMTATDLFTGNRSEVIQVRGRVATTVVSLGESRQVGWREADGVYILIYGEFPLEDLVRVAELAAHGSRRVRIDDRSN